MSTQRQLRFATPIYVRDINPDDIANDALITDILEWKATSRGEVRSNRNGVWHSLEAIGRKPFKPLIHALFDFYGDVFKGEGYADRSVVRIDDMWANVVPRGGYHTQHIHGGCLWSGVYYARAPVGSGKLILRDPRIQTDFWTPRHHDDRWPIEVAPVIKIKPKTGRMVAFPAWLSHRVDAGDHDEPRIAVSFNVSQVVRRRTHA